MCLGRIGAGSTGRGGSEGPEKSQGGFVEASGDDELPSAWLTLSDAVSSFAAHVRTRRSEGRRRESTGDSDMTRLDEANAVCDQTSKLLLEEVCLPPR